MKTWQKTLIPAIIFVIIGAVIYWKPEMGNTRPEGTAEGVPAQAIPANSPISDTAVVVSGMRVPWEITILPDGDLLVTERSGSLRVIGNNQIVINVPGVVERGEGGLLGLALHPGYSSNKFVYLYFTTLVNGRATNRVVRFTFDGAALDDMRVIIDSIPGGDNHNGGRIAFGPDDLLYVTTGDAGSADLAQDIDSLAGKILRVKDDGSIPGDNPFGNAVYSYGHRNPQGLAWDAAGGLWSTEHGRSGAKSGYDEINYIEKSANYGWPVIEGTETREGMKSPVLQSGATNTWAPAGMAHVDGRLYFTGLRGKTLYEVEITSPGRLRNLKEHFKYRFGRLRAIAARGDGSLLVSTSNRDGRGDAEEADDRILRISIGAPGAPASR